VLPFTPYASHPAISAEFLGAEIVRMGIEPLGHFTCKLLPRKSVPYSTSGLGKSPAALTISATFASHSIAMIWMPRTPGISLSC